MSMLIKVDSIEKGCEVLINLDHIVEIAPLANGGCALFFNDGAAVNGIRSMKVKNSYSQFAQFALETVSSDDIARKIAALNPKKEPKEPTYAQIRKQEIKDEMAAKKAAENSVSL